MKRKFSNSKNKSEYRIKIALFYNGSPIYFISFCSNFALCRLLVFTELA